MDFSIEEYSEEINLTIIEDGDLLEFSIEEVVEEVDITIEEYNGADGVNGIQGEQGIQGIQGEKGEDGLSGIQSVQAGDNITIDNTDPLNPIISAEEGGTTVTKTSDLTNDGEDGTNPFISLNEVPVIDLSPYALDADLDAEVVNRAMADFILDGKITTEKNRNDAQDLAITELQTQHYKTISGNVIIDDTYHNTIWKITANAIITVPSTLRADFIAGFEVIGSFAGTFTEGSGVTFSAPSGKVCNADSSGIIYKNGSATYRLKTS